MLLDNPNVHFNPNEGQVLFMNPSFAIKEELFRPPGFNVLDTDSPYFTYNCDYVANET